MPLRWGREALTTRVGRRIVALFVFCALIPLSAFAVLVFGLVSERLQQAETELRRGEAKLVGMSIADRLLGIQNGAPHAEVEDLGPAPAGLDWTEDARRRLARDESVLFMDPRRSGSVVIGVPRDHSGVEWLRVPMTVLLADLLDGHDVYVFADSRRGGSGPRQRHLLFASDPDHVPELPPGSPPGILEWSAAGEPQLAAAWTLFLARFGASWTVVVSLPRADVVGALATFHRMFALATVLSFLIVSALGLTLVRRTLHPVAELAQVSHRVAEGEYALRVDIRSGDEFEDLGADFNRMVQALVDAIRRREASEAELIVARDSALAAANAEAQFLTNVSHELRTPMTSIRSYAELLKVYDNEPPEVKAEFLDILLAETESLSRMIDDVLDISEMQQGRTNWHFVDIDLVETVREAVAEVVAIREDHAVAVDVDAGSPPPGLAGDRERLKQVWRNLVANAVKFGGHAEPAHVRISATDDRVFVEVIDHGVGIAENELERIFDRFQQVGGDILTEKVRGAGLGLAICRDIVERHGGEIRVDSELGAGTTITVSLPVLTVAQLEAVAVTRVGAGG